MRTDIGLVASEGDLRELFQFRYRIYVEEMHRRQQYADHDQRTIRDPLDDSAYNFVAREDGDIVGCVRVNFAADGGLDYYRDLLRMDALSDSYPGGVALCTRLMVVPRLRGSPLALRFCIAGLELGLEHGIRWNFIDCNDHLVGFFARLGYEWMHKAVHEEYGPVNVMRFNLSKLDQLKAVGSPLLRKFDTNHIDLSVRRAGIYPRSNEASSLDELQCHRGENP